MCASCKKSVARVVCSFNMEKQLFYTWTYFNALSENRAYNSNVILLKRIRILLIGSNKNLMYRIFVPKLGQTVFHLRLLKLLLWDDLVFCTYHILTFTRFQYISQQFPVKLYIGNYIFKSNCHFLHSMVIGLNYCGMIYRTGMVPVKSSNFKVDKTVISLIW